MPSLAESSIIYYNITKISGPLRSEIVSLAIYLTRIVLHVIMQSTVLDLYVTRCRILGGDFLPQVQNTDNPKKMRKEEIA